MDTTSITELRARRDELRKSLRGIKVSQYSGVKFGNEDEYVAKGVVAGIEAIIIDVTSLTSATSKFIQKSTLAERNLLVQIFTKLNTHTVNKNLQLMAETIDEIKPILRSFGVRHTSERKEVLDDHINDLQKSASSLSQDINDISDIKTKGEELKEDIDALHQQLTDKLGSLKEQEEALEQLIGSTEKKRSELELMLTLDQSRSDQIEEFLSESKAIRRLLQALVRKWQLGRHNLKIKQLPQMSMLKN